MRTFTDAQALARAGVTEIAGYAGGRTRRVSFRFTEDGNVAARMFQTDIVTFTPDHVVVRLGGYVTLSTFDGISAALDVSRAVVGKVKGIPYVMGHVLDPQGDNTLPYLESQPYDGGPVTA